MQKYEKEKKWMHEGLVLYMQKMMSTSRLMQNDSHVLMREITDIKEYSIGLTLFYPHTCTS